MSSAADSEDKDLSAAQSQLTKAKVFLFPKRLTKQLFPGARFMLKNTYVYPFQSKKTSTQTAEQKHWRRSHAKDLEFYLYTLQCHNL